MLQKAFEGTEQEFELYRKQQPSVKRRLIVVYEDDQQEENNIPDDQLTKSHVLHPNNRTQLVNRLAEAEKQIQQGQYTKATPEFFENVKKQAREQRQQAKK